MPSKPLTHPLFGEIIISDPSVMSGKWVFRGTDVTIESVLAALADGSLVEDVLTAHPALIRDDVAEFVSFLPYVVPLLRR